MQTELDRAVARGREPYIKGLTSDWEGELKYHVRAMLGLEAVGRGCWRRVMKPFVSCRWRSPKLLAAFANTVTASSPSK